MVLIDLDELENLSKKANFNWIRLNLYLKDSPVQQEDEHQRSIEGEHGCEELVAELLTVGADALLV